MLTSVSLMVHSFPWAIFSMIPGSLNWGVQYYHLWAECFDWAAFWGSTQWMPMMRPESCVGLAEDHSSNRRLFCTPRDNFKLKGWQDSFFKLTHEHCLPSLSRLLICRLCDCFTLVTPVSYPSFTQVLF